MAARSPTLGSFARVRWALPSGRPPRRAARFPTHLAVVLAVLTLVVIPTSSGVGPYRHGAGAVVPGTSAGPVRSAAEVRRPAGLPGADGVPGPVIPAGTLASVHFLPMRNATLPSGARPSWAPSPPRPILPATAARPMPRFAPAGSGGYGTGWVTGTVRDASDRDPVGGAAVQVLAPVLCVPPQCGPFVTSLNGTFNVSCPGAPGTLGLDTLTILASWYLGNVSSFACVAGTTSSLGGIYLVRDGTAVGVVVDAGSGRPIAGATVEAVARDGSVAEQPGATTGSNGSFEIAVPPLPSTVYVLPPIGHEPTFLDINATPGQGRRPEVPPWLGGLNLGSVAVPRQTLIVAHLYDSLAGLPLTSTTSGALTPCHAFDGSCGAQGSAATGGTVTAFADPGWDFFEAFAVGHVPTPVPSRWIPPEPAGTTFDLGRLDLLPYGEFHLRDDLAVPAGGSSPWPTPSPSSGSIYAEVCNLDGLPFTIVFGNFSTATCVDEGCWNAGQPTAIFAPPLRNVVSVIPDAGGICSSIPPWPVPSRFAPVWGNSTYVNLTAGRTLAGPDPVPVDLPVGDYVAGVVRDQRTGAAPPSFTISVDSTDGAGWAPTSVTFDSPPAPAGFAPCAAIATASSGSFCAAVPPGNARMTVSLPDGSVNWTWVHTADACCRTSAAEPGWPTNLSNATESRSDVLEAGDVRTASVTGSVIVAATSGTPVPAFAVEICPLDQANSSQCIDGLGVNGSFALGPVRSGEAEVTVDAFGFQSNSVWIRVPDDGNVSAGTVPLTPDGIVRGRVVGPNGSPVYVARVSVCPVAVMYACFDPNGPSSALGGGLTSTDGEFAGSVAPGWLPYATYVVEASAPGFTPDWTFANVSAGNLTTVGPLTLRPIGTNGSEPTRPAAVAVAGSGTGPVESNAAGVYVTGTLASPGEGPLVDSASGGALQLCPTTWGSCTAISEGTNGVGRFNGSVVPGLYDLNVSLPGYVAASITVNATTAGVVDVGTVNLTADHWVAGRLALAPWSSVTLSTGGTYGNGTSPGAIVLGCDRAGAVCEPPQFAATNGSYAVPIAPASTAVVKVRPSGTALAGSAGGGFEANSLPLQNLTGAWTNLTGSSAVLRIWIYGVLVGRAVDASAPVVNRSGSALPLGVSYASVFALVVGNQSGSVSSRADGAGNWTLFLPGGNGPNSTLVRVGDDPGFTQVQRTVVAPIVAGGVAASAGIETLVRFGWVEAKFNVTPDGDPAAGVAAVASVTDPATGIYYQSSDTSNALGFVNLTAPPGVSVRVDFGGPDLNGSNFSVAQVTSSSTTVVPGPSGGIATFSLEALGWIVSGSVNYTGGAPPPVSTLPAPVVVDATNGQGLPNVAVFTGPGNPVPGSETNGLGQFFAESPIGPSEPVRFARPSYLPNVTTRAVAPGATVTFAMVNLTPFAVVAGVVRGAPGHLPVPYAEVTVCGGTGVQFRCSPTYANGTGVYWAEVPGGSIAISANASGYGSNTTSARVCPGCWGFAGTTWLPEDGALVGRVRGLPSGFPLADANVSLCPALGPTDGGCPYVSRTGTFGGFVLEALPGDYVLMVAAPGYNTTVLPIAVGAGERTDLGTLFVSALGEVAGGVVDSATGAPIDGATVLACPTFGNSTCSPGATTGTDGGYRTELPAGTYLVGADASGYRDGYVAVTVASGALSEAPTIALDPIGTGAGIPLTGSVEDASTGSPIPSATVAAYAGNSTVASTATAGDGAFRLVVPYGSYELLAWSRGYTPVSESVRATSPVAGLVFGLLPARFVVEVAVADGLTGQPLPDVAISEAVGGGDVRWGSTGPDGSLGIPLSNGTHDLVAEGPGAVGEYAPTPFVVVVNGAPSVRNLSMLPLRTMVHVEVVDALSGRPLPAAAVRIEGTVEPGYSVHRELATGVDGRVATQLYDGTYEIVASMPGFTAGHAAWTNRTGNASVTVALVPDRASAPRVGVAPGPVAAAAAIAGLVAVAAILRRRRRPGPPGPTMPGR